MADPPTSTTEPTDPGPPEPNGPARSSLKTLLVYGLCIGGLFAIRFLPPVDTHVVQPYTALVAIGAELIVKAFGTEIVRDDLVIRSPDFSLVIQEECNGISALLIFLAAVLAHPVAPLKKLFGIALGIPAIYVFNEIRVVSLYYIKWHWPAAFDVMHEYVWQALVIIFAIVAWLFWAGLCDRSRQGKHGEAAAR
jgi:exosortase H (IPTLxxWG-CTERM-specific)